MVLEIISPFGNNVKITALYGEYVKRVPEFWKGIFNLISLLGWSLDRLTPVRSRRNYMSVNVVTNIMKHVKTRINPTTGEVIYTKTTNMGQGGKNTQTERANQAEEVNQKAQ